jgi:ABC-type uncharacterized transport system YnjBCD ATPase subunit
MAGRLRGRLGLRAPVVEIPAAGHHVLLDEPLSLVTALRTVLASWAAPQSRDSAVTSTAVHDTAREG